MGDCVNEIKIEHVGRETLIPWLRDVVRNQRRSAKHYGVKAQNTMDI